MLVTTEAWRRRRRGGARGGVSYAVLIISIIHIIKRKKTQGFAWKSKLCLTLPLVFERQPGFSHEAKGSLPPTTESDVGSTNMHTEFNTVRSD